MKPPKPARKIGRPPVWKQRPTLEAELLKRIAETGCSIKDAAICAGIGYATVKERQQSDQDFCDRLIRATTTFKVENLHIIAKAREKHYTAAVWWNERRFPEEFGRYRGERESTDDEIAESQLKADHDDEYARALRADPQTRLRLDDALRALDKERAENTKRAGSGKTLAGGPGVDRGAVLATRGASAPTQSVSDRGRRKAP